MRYLTCEEVIQICQFQIEKLNGVYGLRDFGLIESAVESVKQTAMGELLLPTLEDAASGYWFYICQAHAFIDGNKRTAAQSVEVFLLLNGHELDLSSQDVESMTLDIASGRIRTREDVRKLIRIRPHKRR